MRRTITLFLLPFFGLLASETFTYKSDDGDKTYSIARIEDVRFSKNCDNTCLALQAFQGRLQPAPDESPAGKILGNPASKYCSRLGGQGVILRDKDNKQYDFCRFKDDSLVDAWRLYENR